MRSVQWLFFATAFAGVLMVKGFDPRINWLYFGLGVSSAMAAAVAYLATMKCRETDHPVGVVIWFHLVAVPVTGGWTAFTWVPPVGNEWLLVLAVGLLGVVAQVAMTFALQRRSQRHHAIQVLRSRSRCSACCSTSTSINGPWPASGWSSCP